MSSSYFSNAQVQLLLNLHRLYKPLVISDSGNIYFYTTSSNITHAQYSKPFVLCHSLSIYLWYLSVSLTSISFVKHTQQARRKKWKRYFYVSKYWYARNLGVGGNFYNERNSWECMNVLIYIRFLWENTRNVGGWLLGGIWEDGGEGIMRGRGVK